MAGLVLNYNPYKQRMLLWCKNNNGDEILEDLDSDIKDDIQKLESNIILQNRFQNLKDVLSRLIKEGYKEGIDFVGTKKDFEDFKSLADDLKIQLDKRETEWYLEREEIMTGIKTMIVDLKSKTDEENIEGVNNETIFAPINDILESRTPIVLFGQYSAGKSSVLNALIGAEVFESNSDPTTQCVVEITPSEDFSICWEDKQYCLACDKKDSLVQELKDSGFEIELPDSSENDDVRYIWMREILKAINDNLRGSTEIKVSLKFKNLGGICKQIVFYDTPGYTPGNNGTLIPEHGKILAQKMKEFSKGVPVFVKTRKTNASDSMRSFLTALTGSEEILKVLNPNIGIVLVNQADGESVKGIEENKKKRIEIEKNNNRTDFELDETRMVFFSSPFALLTKSNPDNWEDSGMISVADNPRSMTDTDYKLYCPLATVANLPKLRKNSIVSAYEKAEQAYKEDPSEEHKMELIAHNSGLRAFENELTYVVGELAVTNLCARASDELGKGLEFLGLQLKQMRENHEKYQSELKQEFDKKHEDIAKKLDSIQNDAKKDVKKHYADYVTQKTEANADEMGTGKKEAPKSLEAIIREVCESVTTASDWKKYKKLDNDNLSNKIKEVIDAKINPLFQEREKDAEVFYNKYIEDVKEKCRKAVLNDSSLSEEEKKALNECIDNITTSEYVKNYSFNTAGTKKSFLGIIHWMDRIKTKDEIEVAISNYSMSQQTGLQNSTISQCQKAVSDIFAKFYTENRIDELNPELIAKRNEIENTKRKIEKLEIIQNTVLQDIAEANTLLEKHPIPENI